MMNNNKLVIAAAGSGKTTYLVEKALEIDRSERVLITTYTEVNEAEIRKKILKKKKYISSNITIQTWFSFLLQHGVRPYQGAIKDILYAQDIKGMVLTSTRSAYKVDKDGKAIMYNGHKIYWGENDFIKHYFTKEWKIYSDKISKFVIKADKATKGKVIKRISDIYQHIYIDEVQDLAGYDLEIIKSLFKTNSSVLLVGDPRQVTYLTHHESKYSKYKNGKIVDFIENELGKRVKCEIDKDTLNVSHRSNKEICEYSSKLYPSLPKISPCSCQECRNYTVKHEGVFLIKEKDVKEYVQKYNPTILRWNKSVKVEHGVVYNMGESKGKTFDGVLIYPTNEMKKWINDNNYNFTKKIKGKVKELTSVKAKFYVAITRARYSVVIVYDYDDKKEYEGLIKYSELEVIDKVDLLKVIKH